MPLNAEDLPADVRRRLGIKAGRTRTTRHEAEGPVHMRCHECQTEFHHTTGPDGWETHGDETGHIRFECVL